MKKFLGLMLTIFSAFALSLGLAACSDDGGGGGNGETHGQNQSGQNGTEFFHGILLWIAF